MIKADTNNERFYIKFGCSEFSSYNFMSQNRVTQNDNTLRITNSKIFIENFDF